MKLFAVTVIVLGAVGLSAEASAYCRSTTCRSAGAKECVTDKNSCPAEGAKLFWPTSCINFAFNAQGTQDLDPEETFAVMRKTFQAWTEVPCPSGGNATITFEERGPILLKKSAYNKEGRNVNVILFQDDDWKYRGIDGTLAKTSVTYNDETGEIYDADIEVNAANNTVTLPTSKRVDYDLQAIMTHEVGHFIGIAHSSDGSAVMAPTYSPGSIAQRTLTPDDVGAVCEIYPPKSGLVCAPEPRGGFGDEDPNATTPKACAVARGTGEPAALPVVPFAMAGTGLVAAARRARRRMGQPGRRS